MLVISGMHAFCWVREDIRGFNLAIEMLVISGGGTPVYPGISKLFQSRNRDACHFRLSRDKPPTGELFSFNLAIEMLVISGHPRPRTHPAKDCFNLAIEMLVISGQARRDRKSSFWKCFNLAIEMLVISGQSGIARDLLTLGFNLAIEMLVISGRGEFRRRFGDIGQFQSRNRDACHFRRCRGNITAMSVDLFQSRNRDACHFRREVSRMRNTA